MVTLVIAGEEAPEYNTPVYRHGREVGRLLSPSAGRSPTVDRLIGMACIESELIEVGTPLEVALVRRPHGAGARRPLPDLRPGEDAAAGLTPDRPVGILAEDGHGISVARALQRLLPREDLLLLCDDAYAPYARRRPAVVVSARHEPARRTARRRRQDHRDRLAAGRARRARGAARREAWR